MTREEAVEVLEKMKYPQKVNKNGFIISNVNIENEALDMAISALESLEQIREKIKRAKEDLPLRYNDGLGMALDLIDKYTKGESE